MFSLKTTRTTTELVGRTVYQVAENDICLVEDEALACVTISKDADSNLKYKYGVMVYGTVRPLYSREQTAEAFNAIYDNEDEDLVSDVIDKWLTDNYTLDTDYPGKSSSTGFETLNRIYKECQDIEAKMRAVLSLGIFELSM